MKLTQETCGLCPWFLWGHMLQHLGQTAESFTTSCWSLMIRNYNHHVWMEQGPGLVLLRLFETWCLRWWWTTIEVAADGGSWWQQWAMTVDYSGIRSWWRIMIVMAADHRLWCSRTPWYIIFLLRYSTITDNNPSIHWPSVILQNVHPYQCC